MPGDKRPSKAGSNPKREAWAIAVITHLIRTDTKLQTPKQYAKWGAAFACELEKALYPQVIPNNIVSIKEPE
jgi:hypothetical protein